MIYFFETIYHLILGFTYLALMGYPVLKLLLPKDLFLEYGRLLVFPVGYLILGLGAFSLSASSGLSANQSVSVVSALLAVISVGLLVREGGSLKSLTLHVKQSAFDSVILVFPMFLFMFWPLFINGSETYLGAVNPDYFAGFIDNYFLQQGYSVGDFMKGTDTYSPINYLAGSLSSSARFASGLVGISLETFLGLTTREAMTVSIALFLSCLPATMYFFSRIVFGLDRRAAKYSAWLACVSGPIALSYLYFYLGQNSGLAALPLVLTVGFLTLIRPDPKLLVLFGLLVNALFVTYLGMLAYAIAPLGALWWYLLLTRQTKALTLIALVIGLISVTLVVNFGMLPEIYSMAFGWGNVIGQTLQGQYFLDFLTEMFFPLYLGSVTYPVQNSFYELIFGRFSFYAILVSTIAFALYLLACISRWGSNNVDWRSLLLGVALAFGAYVSVWLACGIPNTHYALIALPFASVVGGFILIAIFLWIRSSTKDVARLVTILSAIIIYTIVWWIYTFERQYGYAVFKMASWLQFLLIPFVAYGMTLRFSGGATFLTNTKNKAMVLGAALFIVSNVATTIEYGVKGMGRDTRNGYIINSFDVAGNRDYFDLEPAIRKHVLPDETVGLMFVDSIQNHWVAYYLRDYRTSMLSHQVLPGDDENLPNILTNLVTDYYGNVSEATNVFFHGATDDFILTWNEGHINDDIVVPNFKTKPIWENSTFRLFRSRDNPDQVFTGRGYYRTEYYDRPMGWWWPKTMRWTAEGGEVYLMRPSKIGEPYRLTFDAIVGFQLDSDSRHIELWANGVKFDEFKVDSATRYVSKPFIPNEQVVKLVIKVKEKVRPMRRPLPIWNQDIPTDYRQLNIGLSNISVLPEGELSSLHDCGGALIGDEMLRCSLSFNGIQVDRWMGDKATIEFDASISPRGSELVIKGFAPGNLNFTYPLDVDVSVNGITSVHQIDSAGEFALVLGLPKLGAGESFKVELDPAEVHDLTGQFRLRQKLVKQSIKLDGFTFR